MIRRFLTLGSGEAVSRVLYLLAFIALARGLGKAALGEFGLALSITSYLVLTVQQGFDQIAIRSVSRNRALLEPYVRGLFGLRLTIAGALYAALVLFVGSRSFERPLLLIFGLTCFTAAAAPRWAFQVISPTQFAIAGTISQAVFCMGAVVVMSGGGIYWAATAYLLGEIISAVYLLQAIRSQIPASPAWVPQFWKTIVRESWPLSLSSLLGILVYNFDILALGWLAAPADLGLYLACYRCATVFSPLLSVLQMSILPAFATAHPNRQRMLSGLRTVAVPTVIAAVLAASVLSIAPETVLRTIYGSGYSGGASILRVLAWSLPVQALRSILRQILLAAHLQRLDTVNMSLAALACIVIDLAFIPRFGPLACAFATLSAETILLTGSAAILRLRVFAGKPHPLITLEDGA